MEIKIQEPEIFLGMPYDINGIKNCYYIGKYKSDQFSQNGEPMEFYRFDKTKMGMFEKLRQLTVNIPINSTMKIKDYEINVDKKDVVFNYLDTGLKSQKVYFNELNDILERE